MLATEWADDEDVPENAPVIGPTTTAHLASDAAFVLKMKAKYNQPTRTSTSVLFRQVENTGQPNMELARFYTLAGYIYCEIDYIAVWYIVHHSRIFRSPCHSMVSDNQSDVVCLIIIM